MNNVNISVIWPVGSELTDNQALHAISRTPLTIGQQADTDPTQTALWLVIAPNMRYNVYQTITVHMNTWSVAEFGTYGGFPGRNGITKCVLYFQ
jgi:hypothetical protein